MPLVEATVSCPVHQSFRVAQVAGMFDVPLAKRATQTFRVEVPEVSEPWKIGAIVGPSGSGKSVVAAEAFGANVFAWATWRKNEAVIEGFDRSCSTREVTETLTAVGFSSPPAWLKPYHVLSTGEQFRCELAAALLSLSSLVVFDEFTSVVDRTVAKVGSLALQRALRDGRFSKKFVAVTCHYDVLDWLEPDWVLDMATGQLAHYYRGTGDDDAGRLLRPGQVRTTAVSGGDFNDRRWQRPPIELEVVRCRHEAWRVFAPHHYLSGSLSPTSRCFLGTWDEQPVAFAGLVRAFGRGQSGWRVSRIVVLPDYQGVGIGGRFLESVAEIAAAGAGSPRHEKVTIKTSHPAVIGHCERSPRWRCHSFTPGGKPVRACDDRGRANVSASRSFGRTTAGFTFLG